MSIMFRDYGMLRFAVRSIEQFAPWVRRIALFTNGQTPTWYNVSAPRTRLYTHDEVFLDQANLPTFNSNAIEAHLRLLPGLSECFLYMNDDFYLGRPTPKSYFVNPATGQLRLYMDRFRAPEPEEMAKNGWHRSVAHSNDLINAVYHPNATEPVRHNYAGHYCYFFKRHILDLMWQHWPDAFVYTSRNRFRDPKDVAVPFMHHNVALEEHEATKERGVNGGGAWRTNHTRNADLWKRLLKNRPYCVCIQDRLDEGNSPATDAEIDFLESSLCDLFPEPSSLEKTTEVNPCEKWRPKKVATTKTTP
jgi:hypothetical protein